MVSEEQQVVGVPKELFETVVEYLTSKPYAEVAPLMEQLQQNVFPVTIAEQTEETTDE